MAAAGVIETGSGPVSGVDLGECTAYLGIPYAQPPIGELRWKPPLPALPWKRAKRCGEYGPACPQPPSKFYDVGKTSEDCLYLNVWVPRNRGERRLPVMAWVHGGAFTTGAGSLGLYEGGNLAASGVVVVTINYRLGPLGFMAHPALSRESPRGVSGNYGLLDQLAALDWIGNNISGFGGDAGCITLFGESAGAVSACLLLTSPMAAGLFQHAIVESGPIWVEKGLPAASRPLEAAEETGRKLAGALGLDGAGSPLESLRAVDAGKLVGATETGDGLAGGGLQFGPAVDGWLLPGDPADLIAAGEIHDLPVIVGANADEANLFLDGIVIDRDYYAEVVDMISGGHSSEMTELFPPGEGKDAAPALGRLFTVTEFVAPARFLAGSFAHLHSDAYLYRFSRHAPGNPLGACHGSEIPYVFGNFDRTLGYDEVDYRVSSAIMSYWTAFARTGNPNLEGLPAWPPYSKDEDRLLHFGDEISTRQVLCSDACDLAERIHLGK